MNDAGKIAFTPKGDYDSTATYEYLDTVVYDGNSYAALKTTTGNTPTDDSEYWKLLVRGGNSVPIATEDINGVVKASEDIGVDSNAKMVLKTDYTEQTELTEIESGETRKTFFGKIAKAISTLVNHININATSAKAGHVKLSNSSAVTDSTGLALPATEKNASTEGTLANQIRAIKYKSFSYEANGLTAYLRKVGRFIDCYIQGQAAQELATASGYATVCAINDDDFKVHPNCMFVQYVFLNNVHYGQCCFTTETALSIGYTKNMSGTSTNIAEGEYIYIHFQYLSKQ